MPALFLSLFLLAAAPAPRVIETFDDASTWKAAPSDGVALDLSSASGFQGKALRLDFDFHGGAGYAVARKELPFALPENYEISFRIRAEAPVNNLEFKLIDPTGDNVWWVNRKNFAFPREWTEVRLKKRHIRFAWGPAGGGEIRNVAAVEFAVTAGTGGKGYVLLDELTLRELPPEHPYTRTPEVTTTAGGTTLDFLESREYSGLVIDWGPDHFASRYEVQTSDDASTWKTVYTVDGGNGGRDYVYLPETDARYLRLRFLEGSGTPKIDVKPLDWAPTPEAFFMAIAKDAPRGLYPRWLLNEQSYWTVVGVPGDTAEGLFNEDGMLESGKGGFSIEPSISGVPGGPIHWSNARATQALVDGYLPLPSVTWEMNDLSLEVTAYATGAPGSSVLRARYRLQNKGKTAARPRLNLAVRPFQVNPSWQFLGNPPGGLAPIRQLEFDGKILTVNDDKKVIPSIAPTSFTAATFDQGPIADGRSSDRTKVSDPFGYASAVMAWDLPLRPGETRDVEVAIPFHGNDPGTGTLADATRFWHAQLDRVDLRIPAAEALVRTLKSNLAYILINQDGPAIQPGSRSYERSWIRDGSLTSAALLRMGHDEEAKAFLAWYAPYQFADGKVPCCVDSRGADPVPENDSHGELIYLAAQVYRFTGDRALLEKVWPQIEKAAEYIETLRQQRRTPDYRTQEKFPYLGLLPESISHEGYSDKPVHSYWDDFFALRGLKDAPELATALGKTEQAARWTAIRNQFQADLMASIRRTISLHKINYLPASVEKGDFDPTSTSIGIAPGGALRDLPQVELRNTFERYYQESIERRNGKRAWEAYTPYELRTIRTFLRLGWRDRAHELLDFFLNDRRPAAWNQWGEVVWREPRAPKFIGDSPHTWVGSEYVHAFLDLLAYVRETDGALVLGAGLPARWNELSVKGLRTEYGPLEYSVTPQGAGVRVHIAAGLNVPRAGIVVRWQDKETVVRELPATVDLVP